MIHLEELLSVYLDGEASPPEVARVERHLTDCHRCRIRLTEINAARTAIRSLPVLEMPSRLVVAGGSMSPKRRPMVWVGAAAAVAASVITVATFTTPPPEPLSLAEVSRQFGERTALDVGVAPLKVVVPPVEILE